MRLQVPDNPLPGFSARSGSRNDSFNFFHAEQGAALPKGLPIVVERAAGDSASSGDGGFIRQESAEVLC